MQISDYICIGLCACTCILGRSELLISCYLNTLVWFRTLWLKKSSTEWSQEKGEKQWFSKCDPWTSSLSIIWVFVQTANSWTLPTRYLLHQKFWAGPCNWYLSKPSQWLWFWCKLKFENHCFKKIQSWSQKLPGLRSFSNL